MSEERIEWPAQWLRGPLPLCVLRVIAGEQPVHGYGIQRALETAGFGTIGGGTLYPMLGRLERDGYVVTEWVAGGSGPARKTYAITPAGEKHLALASSLWARFTHTTTTLMAAYQWKGQL